MAVNYLSIKFYNIGTWGQFHQHFYVWLFQSFFGAQLSVTCQNQPAQLSATCKWHNQYNFCMKKHSDFFFQKQAAFLSFP
jgi:hypothetical protein